MLTLTRTHEKRSKVSEFSSKHKQDEINSVHGNAKEPVPLITYSEFAYCIFCKRNSPPLIKLPSGIFINLTGNVHEICLKHKGCCECGVLGLCYRCTVKDCQRLIHSWCAQGLHGNANFCGLHSNTHKKKDMSRLAFIKSISRKIVASSFWDKDYKDKDSPSLLCNGHIFWTLLNFEYFPSGYDLSCFPVFPLCCQFDLEYESGNNVNYVTKMIEKVSSDIEKCQASNSSLVSQIMKKIHVKQKIGEDSLYKSVRVTDESNENVGNVLGVNDVRSEFNSTQADTVKSFKKFCEICEEDGEDEVVSCVKCLVGVHLKCYKVVLSEEFVCETCSFYGSPTNVSCVLCPKAGGVFKMTLHHAKDILFPSYVPFESNKSQGKQPVWVHSFCALRTSGVVFRNKGVDLSCIDTSRLHVYCEICNTKDGYCLQCSFSTCYSNYHANCARDLFVSTKSNEKKLYCPLHKPTKLRKILESRQKQIFEDLYKFCRGMEKYFSRIKTSSKSSKKKKRIRSKNSFCRIFSPDEDLQLDYKIQQFLYKLNISQKKPFILSINLTASTRCSRVNISRPQYYTIISPYVILEEGISIDGRLSEECFKRYQDTLYNRLKNEMLLLGKQICVYHGKDIHQNKNSSRLRKKPQESKSKISADTYCICKQPYFYEIPWEPEWTQEEWEQKIRDNEMIECTKCEKWFHLKCVGYVGSLEKAQTDENWKCGICDENTDKGERDGYGRDVSHGVVTRRGAKGL